MERASRHSRTHSQQSESGLGSSHGIREDLQPTGSARGNEKTTPVLTPAEYLKFNDEMNELIQPEKREIGFGPMNNILL